VWFGVFLDASPVAFNEQIMQLGQHEGYITRLLKLSLGLSFPFTFSWLLLRETLLDPHVLH
jgi:hypothetical protein